VAFLAITLMVTNRNCIIALSEEENGGEDMNKSLIWWRVPVTTALSGRVYVAKAFEDAKRGTIRSGAAELLAATIDGSTTEPGTEDGVMFAVSYLDRYGRPGGFALVADHEDERETEEIARRWMRVLRSRRLTIADVPALCWGGQRGQTMIAEAAAEYVVGRPVGAHTGTIVADLDQVPDGARVALPAHGASLAVRAEAAARGMRVTDATCPLVAAVHADAAAYASRGDTVVVIGDPAHAATRVLAEQADEAAVVVSAADQLNDEGIDPEQVSFVIDPGLQTEHALAILAVLRRRFPHLRGHHFDILCDAASNRARTIESVAATSELMLVVTGDRAEPVAGTRVTRLADLSADLFDGITSVGLASTLSAPAGLADDVVRALSGLGPLSVVRHGASTNAGMITPVPLPA
jgi:4-hydroxy-3-methylbut-2-enyl diphosphate reductase